MDLNHLVFYYLALGMTIPGILAVISRNPVHAVLWVLVLILHQALLLYTLGSEFLTAIQIIVYAGAVLVLFLFVVYMINLRLEERWKVFVRRSGIGLILIFVFVFLLFKTISVFLALVPAFKPKLPYDLAQASNLVWIARYLFTHYLLQFELIGVILLIVVLGAVFILKKLKEVKNDSF